MVCIKIVLKDVIFKTLSKSEIYIKFLMAGNFDKGYRRIFNFFLSIFLVLIIIMKING